uniref:Cysteine sulfinic acid decarboxylase n=1 Tax=Phallusia mammillata TaxID=59560 RepID=A0A6F9D9C7_9ASCI|nr:cysteine sulfinic acid decarboxylase [Phallusia mammillata]
MILNCYFQGILRSQQIRQVIKCGRMASSKASHAEEDKFLKDVFDLSMRQTVQKSRDRCTPVLNFRTPQEIQGRIDLGLHPAGESNGEVLKLCEKVFENSVNTGHPRFFNQLFAGLDSYGFAGSIMLDALNTQGHTYEISPALTVIELEVVKHMLKFVGYEGGEGTFNPGGSYSNMLAMNVARIRNFPDSKVTGVSGLPLLVNFCSEQSHYSAQKNSALLGFGEANCKPVKCDERGKMIPEDLEKSILEAKEKGAAPFFVTATAGTTVLGAFDPFNEIADICERHNIWLHVDGAWGGSALLSEKHKHLCNGVERSDSFAWNPHKLMAAPVQTSVLLLKEKDLLRKSHSLNVPYLFQDDKPYDTSYDLGRSLVACGRKCDAFKLWVMWKSRGDSGFEKQIDKALDNAKYLTEAVKNHPHFRLVIPELEFTNVPFWYVPPSLRGETENEEFFTKLGKIVPIVKKRMQISGLVLVGYTSLPNIPTFFRMTIANEQVEKEDLDFLLAEIERNAADL